MVRPIDCGKGNVQHAPRVHFSPVVSQLRYREQHGCLRPIRTTKLSDHNNTSSSSSGHMAEAPNYCQQSSADSDRGGGDGGRETRRKSNNESCERVTVHVQEVIVPAPPPVQKVQMQKIQVTVPSQDGSGSDRYALEVNVPPQMSSSSSSSSSSSTAPFQIMDHPPVKINVEDKTASSSASPHPQPTTSPAQCPGSHKNNKQSYFMTVLGTSGGGSGCSCSAIGSDSTCLVPHSNSNSNSGPPAMGDHFHLSMNNSRTQPSHTTTHNNDSGNGHVPALGLNTKNGFFANAINKTSESVSDSDSGYGKYSYGLPDQLEWHHHRQFNQRNSPAQYYTQQREQLGQDFKDRADIIGNGNKLLHHNSSTMPPIHLGIGSPVTSFSMVENPYATLNNGSKSNYARNENVCNECASLARSHVLHHNNQNSSCSEHSSEVSTTAHGNQIWPSKNNNFNKICDRDNRESATVDGKVKKTFMKSKLSFLQRITLGKLGNQSKSKSKSASSIISKSKGTTTVTVTGPTISSSNKSKNSASSPQVVVPVSSWPVKSSTKVVVVDSPESPPVNKSCSAYACSDLCQFKKNSFPARKPSVLRRDPSAGTEVGTGGSSGVYHDLDPVNNRGSRSVDSIPHHTSTVVPCTTAPTKNPWLFKTNEEEGTGRKINYAVTLSNDADVSLVSRNIPFTDNWEWDSETADQSHFDSVRNVREASVVPTSHLSIFSSPSDYPNQEARVETISGDGLLLKDQVRDSATTGEVKTVGPRPSAAARAVSTLENKNVATSPIHHLSTFYALNLPIVPPKFASLSSSSPSASSTSKDLAAGKEEGHVTNSPTPAPVPKPRVKKSLRRKTSLDSSSDTDELSANVDKILDEIAGFELECLKMEMNGNFLDSEGLQNGPNQENRREPTRPRLANSQSTMVDAERKRTGLRSNHEPGMPFGKPPLPPSAKNVTVIRQQFFNNNNPERDEGELLRMDGKPGLSEADLDVKLLKFRLQLYRSREELAKSHPNLEEIEDTVRSSLVIDRSRRQRTLPLSLCRGSENPDILPGYTTTHDSEQIHPLTPDPVTTEKERCRAEEWSSLCRQISENYLRSPPSNSNCHGNIPDPFYSRGIVETDLDTGASREIISGRNNDRQLFLESFIGQPHQLQYEWNETDHDGRLPETNSKNLPLSIFPDDGRLSFSLNQKTQSMLNLGSPTSTMSHSNKKSATLQSSSNTGATDTSTLGVAATSSDERARSMEFLLDDSDKNAHLRPPENNLMMRQENRQLSEHELRIQRSLNKLNVPDWYKKNAPSPSSGSAGGSKAKEFGSGTGLAGGWTGLSSAKTSSLTSLQSTGRSHFSRLRSSGTASSGARSSRESLMSPSSTASASPSPYYERSSFTYGMPYALTRFASARMSCGASPASLSPSPSPVGGAGGSSTSTPVSSAPLSRHHSYSKAPYLGWRSQERLTSKTLYRSPAERMADDVRAQKTKGPSSSASASTLEDATSTREVTGVVSEKSPKKETASSDLSLNNSEESNSHKLNRVRSSIKEVSNAIVDYVNESKPLDDGINGASSPRRGFVWLESSFVGTKPIDSPRTPDTPTAVMTSSRHASTYDSGSSSSVGRPKNVFRFDDHQVDSGRKEHGSGGRSSGSSTIRTASSTNDSSLVSTANGSTPTYTPYHSRNEQMEERSNSSSVSSPTLEDILDSLLALRRPNKKIRARTGKGHSREPPPLPPPRLDPTPISDWQERMNQPLQDIVYFPVTDDFFPTSTVITATTTTTTVTALIGGGSSGNNYVSDSYDISSLTYHYKDSSEVEGSSEGVGVPIPVVVEDAAFRNFSSSNHEEKCGRLQMIDNDNVPPEETVETSTAHELEESDLSHPAHDPSAPPPPPPPPPHPHPFGQDEVDKEENAFGTPTEIYTTTTTSSSSVVNTITSANDSSNPPTPARHRRVSFDLDISDKEEKSSSRSRRDESVGTILCRNSKCGRNATGLEARREFKTCHNCNAYYCSRECRRAHWEKHKKVCMQSRVGALCKQIINHVKEDSFVVSQLSAVARRGVLAKGRGCVKLFFSSPDRAERFLTGGLPELPEPWYIPCGDILPEEMGAQTFQELSEQCRTYSGEARFVLYVSVCVVNEVPTSGAVKWEREMISRSAKLRLLMPRNYEETQMHHQAATSAHLFPEEPSSAHPSQPHQPYESDLNNSGAQENLPPPPPPHGPSSTVHANASTTPSSATATTTPESDTLILRSVPLNPSHQLSGSEHRKLREVSFTSIQMHLEERGVDLRGMYPDIYSKLCNYVENDEPFLPVTIYPRNMYTGRQFVCVIMPETSESDEVTFEDCSGVTMSTDNCQVETINIISEQSSVNFDNYSLR